MASALHAANLGLISGITNGPQSIWSDLWVGINTEHSWVWYNHQNKKTSIDMFLEEKELGREGRHIQSTSEPIPIQINSILASQVSPLKFRSHDSQPMSLTLTTHTSWLGKWSPPWLMFLVQSETSHQKPWGPSQKLGIGFGQSQHRLLHLEKKGVYGTRTRYDSYLEWGNSQKKLHLNLLESTFFQWKGWCPTANRILLKPTSECLRVHLENKKLLDHYKHGRCYEHITVLSKEDFFQWDQSSGSHKAHGSQAITLSLQNWWLGFKLMTRATCLYLFLHKKPVKQLREVKISWPSLFCFPRNSELSSLRKEFDKFA